MLVFDRLQVAEDYFSKISERSPGGLMDKADFVEIFHIAFPSRFIYNSRWIFHSVAIGLKTA